MRKAFVFDFDDTLAMTDACVLVLAPINREGYFGGATRKVAKRLTPAEFNNYKLQRDEEFDFSQFKNWYSQSGTPQLSAEFSFSEEEKTFTLKLNQKTPSTPDQSRKLPFHFPLKMSLISKTGHDLPLKLREEHLQPQINEGVLHIKNEEEVFVFENISERPLVSLNRNFSAPIRLNANYSNEELAQLMIHDSDEFNRYEAGQVYATRIIEDLILKTQNGQTLQLPESYIQAFGRLLDLEGVSFSFKAKCLCLPSGFVLFRFVFPRVPCHPCARCPFVCSFILFVLWLCLFPLVFVGCSLTRFT